MVLADGMGGHNQGQVAAQLLVQTMTDLFRARATPTLPNLQAFLLDGIYAAHEAINNYALRHGLCDPPRTTCVAAVVQRGVACWAHVGDSRLYHFDCCRLLSRTRDHSTVQLLIDEGILHEEAIKQHPDRNRLYTSVGGFALPEIEIADPVTLGDGHVLLLCSDGVWSELNDQEIESYLRNHSLDQAIQQIMHHAESRGGRHCDNMTIIAMRYGTAA